MSKFFVVALHLGVVATENVGKTFRPHKIFESLRAFGFRTHAINVHEVQTQAVKNLCTVDAGNIALAAEEHVSCHGFVNLFVVQEREQGLDVSAEWDGLD
jgi:hypothetical protein